MLTAADIKGACKLLKNYLTKYKLMAEFNKDKFAHWFLSCKNIIDTFVAENDVFAWQKPMSEFIFLEFCHQLVLGQIIFE